MRHWPGLQAVAARWGVPTRALACLILLMALPGAVAETLYKYYDADGNLIFSDRPPPDGRDAETRDLDTGIANPVLAVTHRVDGEQISFVAMNEFHAPVEVMLRFNRVRGFEYPGPEESLRWVVKPKESRVLLSLAMRTDGSQPEVDYVYEYLVGSPTARHSPPGSYRTPYAQATEFPITQAYPDAVTHRTPDSTHAVDFAMPVGTNIYAARGGTVFAVSTQNYRGGLDTSRHGANANVVQILHDDGTFAVYAHLNRSSIRVRPGDTVRRGELIAASGNTGYSTGPHLHFAVIRNAGMRLESVPVTFEGPNSTSVTPQTGKLLMAY